MKIKRGDFVKIRREHESSAERFWVEVLFEHDIPKVFEGRVNNNLIVCPYKLGDSISFTKEEVLEVYNEE